MLLQPILEKATTKQTDSHRKMHIDWITSWLHLISGELLWSQFISKNKSRLLLTYSYVSKFHVVMRLLF